MPCQYEYKSAGHRWVYDVSGRRTWCRDCETVITDMEYRCAPQACEVTFRSSCPNPVRKMFHDLMYAP